MLSKTNREQWLSRAVDELRPLFKQVNKVLPKKIRVSVGFPLGSRTAGGECWSVSCSADGTFEIFVSPRVAKPVVVLTILTHELCHTRAGIDAKHGKDFKAVAAAIGLEGKMEATTAGPELLGQLYVIAKTLGKYPHAILTPTDKKKQSTRLIKLQCPDCDYIVRATRKHLDEKGPVICPVHHVAFREEKL